MMPSDVYNQVQDIYDLNISETTVSNITERIIEVAKEWQQRALEPVYFAVWMDGIVLKIREDGNSSIWNKKELVFVSIMPLNIFFNINYGIVLLAFF